MKFRNIACSLLLLSHLLLQSHQFPKAEIVKKISLFAQQSLPSKVQAFSPQLVYVLDNKIYSAANPYANPKLLLPSPLVVQNLELQKLEKSLRADIYEEELKLKTKYNIPTDHFITFQALINELKSNNSRYLKNFAPNGVYHDPSLPVSTYISFLKILDKQNINPFTIHIEGAQLHEPTINGEIQFQAIQGVDKRTYAIPALFINRQATASGALEFHTLIQQITHLQELHLKNRKYIDIGDGQQLINAQDLLATLLLPMQERKYAQQLLKGLEDGSLSNKNAPLGTTEEHLTKLLQQILTHLPDQPKEKLLYQVPYNPANPYQNKDLPLPEPLLSKGPHMQELERKMRAREYNAELELKKEFNISDENFENIQQNIKNFKYWANKKWLLQNNKAAKHKIKYTSTNKLDTFFLTQDIQSLSRLYLIFLNTLHTLNINPFSLHFHLVPDREYAGRTIWLFNNRTIDKKKKYISESKNFIPHDGSTQKNKWIATIEINSHFNNFEIEAFNTYLHEATHMTEAHSYKQELYRHYTKDENYLNLTELSQAHEQIADLLRFTQKKSWAESLYQYAFGGHIIKAKRSYLYLPCSHMKKWALKMLKAHKNDQALGFKEIEPVPLIKKGYSKKNPYTSNKPNISIHLLSKTPHTQKIEKIVKAQLFEQELKLKKHFNITDQEFENLQNNFNNIKNYVNNIYLKEPKGLEHPFLGAFFHNLLEKTSINPDSLEIISANLLEAKTAITHCSFIFAQEDLNNINLTEPIEPARLLKDITLYVNPYMQRPVFGKYELLRELTHIIECYKIKEKLYQALLKTKGFSLSDYEKTSEWMQFLEMHHHCSGILLSFKDINFAADLYKATYEMEEREQLFPLQNKIPTKDLLMYIINAHYQDQIEAEKNGNNNKN